MAIFKAEVIDFLDTEEAQEMLQLLDSDLSADGIGCSHTTKEWLIAVTKDWTDDDGVDDALEGMVHLVCALKGAAATAEKLVARIHRIAEDAVDFVAITPADEAIVKGAA